MSDAWSRLLAKILAGIIIYVAMELYFKYVDWRNAQQSMHLTSGSLRDLLASFWLRVSSALKHFTSPPTGR